MSLGFKRFNFFSHTTLRSHGFPPNATCHAEAGGGGGGSSEQAALFVGCDSGAVVALDGGLQALHAFAAHGHRVLHMRWAPRGRALVTLGVEEPGVSSATVKVRRPPPRPLPCACVCVCFVHGGR